MTVTHQQPSDGYPPAHGYSPPAGRSRARLSLIVGSVIAGGFVLALVLTLVLTSGDSGEPEPISRSELLAEYTDLVPSEEPFATEEGVADLAKTTCGLLDREVPTSEMVTSYASIYDDNSTTAQQVLQLLASYGCPNHLEVLD